MPKERGSAAERFWRKVKKSDGCWEWTGTKNSRGYGMFTPTPGKRVLAHRFSWEMENGRIPDGLFGCHRCDNPGCVRPDHLFVGTNSDNIRDAVAKGRIDMRAVSAKSAAARTPGTHCGKGHPPSGNNAYRKPSNGQILCRQCRKEYAADYEKTRAPRVGRVDH